ncbi:MAG TPA: helix-turn-helix domain-containing protein [Aridibacter sp.]|nr:helix-turn-helix domain-containing protein [Aridibacter sp.]
MIEFLTLWTAGFAILAVAQTRTPQRAERSDEDYEILTLSKGLIVLEALEGTLEEPIPITRITERTGFDRNFTMRALRTLRLKGYAVQHLSGDWMLGTKITRFADRSRRL